MTDRLTEVRRLLLQAQARLLNERDPELIALAAQLSRMLDQLQAWRVVYG